MSIASVARRPGRFARTNQVPAALGLFAGTVAIQSLRGGALPGQSELVHLAIGAAVIVVLADVVPDLATTLLLAVFIAAALRNADVVGQVITRAGGASL